MIGGDNRRYKISNDMAVQMAQQLAALPPPMMPLFLVPSRRCPDRLNELTSALPENCILPPTTSQPLSRRFGDG